MWAQTLYRWSISRVFLSLWVLMNLSMSQIFKLISNNSIYILHTFLDIRSFSLIYLIKLNMLVKLVIITWFYQFFQTIYLYPHFSSFICLLLIRIIKLIREKLKSNLIFRNKLKCESDFIITNGGSIICSFTLFWGSLLYQGYWLYVLL